MKHKFGSQTPINNRSPQERNQIRVRQTAKTPTYSNQFTISQIKRNHETVKTNPGGGAQNYMNNKIEYYKRLDEIRAYNPNSYKIQQPLFNTGVMSPRVKGPDSLHIDPR